MVRIGFLMRLLSAIIDGVILLIPIIVVIVLFHLIIPGGYVQSVLTTLAMGAIVLGYSYLEVLKAQTPGKMALKLMITNQDGSPATKDQLTKRFLFKQIPNLIGIAAAVIGFIGIIHMLLNGVSALASLALIICACFTLGENKLAYYDEMFGTAVYGPGTLPQGFPVQIPAQAGAAAPPPPPAV